MLNYKGGSPAKDGFYWKKGEWEIVTVDGENGRLPGDIECEYVRLPALLFVPAAMMLSVPFVVFLPFIGFAMLFVLIGVKAGKGVGALSRAFAENLARLRARVTETTEELVTEIAEDMSTGTAEELATESAEDPVTDTAEDFVTDNAEDFVADYAEHLDSPQ